MRRVRSLMGAGFFAGALMGVSVPSVHAESEGQFREGIETGEICVAAPASDASKLLKVLKQLGMKATLDAAADNGCQNYNDSWIAIKFEEGLEAQAATAATSSGIVWNFGSGPEDDNGYRTTVKREGFLLAVPTAKNLTAIKADLACKIKARLKENFDKVQLRPCAAPLISGGLCWDISLGGQTSSSGGFNPTQVKGLSDGYSFKVESELWVGYFEDRNDAGAVTGDEVKFRVQIDNDKYARAQLGVNPSADRYKVLENDSDPDDQNSYLSDRLERRLGDIILKTPMQCKVR